MAVIPLATSTQSGAFVAAWGASTASDTGAPWGEAGQTDKTVVVVGAGGSFALKGSNDLTNWNTLHNFDSADTAITASGIFLIKENPLWIRPEGAMTSVVITAR